MDKVIIFGSARHAKSVIFTIEAQGKYDIIGLIDSYREVGESTLGYKVIGSEADVLTLIDKHQPDGVFVAVGHNYFRHLVVERLKKMGIDLPYINVIHPSVQFGKEVTIGHGIYLGMGAFVLTESVVDDHCLIDCTGFLGVSCKMENFSSIGPGARTGGKITMGMCSALTMGASLIQELSIGAHAVIGAGATVVRDIPPYALAVGVPAKVIRERQPDENYLKAREHRVEYAPGNHPRTDAAELTSG